MKHPLFLLALLAGRVLAAEGTPESTVPPPLDPVLQRPALWTATIDELGPELQSRKFEWVSAAKDTARSVAPGLTFGGKPLTESLLRFDGGKLSSVTLVYFARGDAEGLREKEFEALGDELVTSLTSLTGKNAVDRGRDATSAVKAEGKVWDTADSRLLLEWSVTKESRTKGIPFRAEFIRLNILPRNATVAAIGATQTSNSSRQAVKNFNPLEHVDRGPGGEVKLKDVPMVDQGDKGYCVVASVERVMRYYGAQVDQNELAQIANSDADKGTSSEAMIESLKRLTSRLGVKVKPVMEWSFPDFLKMVEDYNRATRRGKLAPEVDLGGRMVDISACYAQMKPEILREVRLKRTADFGKFQREIQRNIDAGIPLLWSIQVGIVPEKGIMPQASGGHMRLIIGYNNSTKEVIYSDSWGYGHEEKRMSLEDAWTITSALSALQPIGS